MKGLKDMLLCEQRRLEEILEKTTKEMEEDVPPGSLQISATKKWIQFYQCMPGDKTKGRYIPKENQKLICRLAQKSYDEKIIRLVSKRLAQIQKITRDYEDDEVEMVYWKEHKEKQKRIRPVETIWKRQIEEWENQEYRGKGFREDAPLILTERGERVRSKSEKILADFFYRNRIPYKYECPLYLKNLGIVYPDFTFLSAKTGQEIYWEHDGRMDDPTYAQNAVRKICAYEENGIYPGERLILTFETEKTVLNMQIVERLVHKYLKEP